MRCELTAALADRPIADENSSISMMTKGGLNALTQNLAVEYAKDGIRFNAVAPGVTDTPMHANDPNNSNPQPAMKKATVNDIVDAVLYLAQACHVSGEILHVDGAAPAAAGSCRQFNIVQILFRISEELGDLGSTPSVLELMNEGNDQ